MSLEISKKAIKISFIQTLPGQEFSVVEQLKKACSQCGVDDDEYVITKGFGTFDIVLIYAAKNFDEHLTIYGPIPGILRTSRSFCFHYGPGKLQDFFCNIKQASFSAVSLIKYNDSNHQRVIEIERSLVDTLSITDQAVNSYVFGTLGWSELLVIYCSDSINHLVKRLFWSAENAVEDQISKTYSFFCLNHSLITQDGKVNEDPSLKEPISNGIWPYVKITCVPRHCSEIASYWLNNDKYVANYIIGKEDIVVTPTNTVLATWGEFINDLLCFRKAFSSHINSTHTIIQHHVNGFKYSQQVDIIANDIDTLTYDYEVLKGFFDEKSAMHLSSNINILKSLLQCNITGNAFTDMKRYVDYIMLVGTTDNNRQRKINFAWQVTDYIKSGAELRIFGTHGTFEESSGQFIKIRGGVHRAITAIELFPEKVISRLITDKRWTWKGFVCAGGKNINQVHDIIVIPDDVLWKPGTWWAVYHEIAHQLINRFGADISKNTPEIRAFLSNKKAEDKWFTLIVELAAELIGYELGFFSDYALFFNKVWSYIYEISYKCGEPKSTSSYVLRTYFVKLMSEYIAARNKNLFDKEKVFCDLVTHMEDIEKFYKGKTLKSNLFGDKYFDAANYCMIFKELLPWIDNRLIPLIDKTQLRSDINWPKDPTVEAAYANITRGIPYYSRVNYPDALLYLLTKHELMPFNVEVATILTFWHQARA